MTREDARIVQETHRCGADGNCTGPNCDQAYPCDELNEALGVIGGTVAAT